MDTRIEGDTCGETGTRNDVERECEEDRERDDRPVNIEKYKTRAFVHARRAEQRGRTERRQVPNGRGSEGPALEFKKKLDCKWCNQSYSGALFAKNFLLLFNCFKFISLFFPNPEQLRFFRSSWQLCHESEQHGEMAPRMSPQLHKMNPE